MTNSGGTNLWTKAKSLHLIDHYGRHQYLWDCTHQLYRSKQKRSEGYQALAEEVGASVEEVKRKLDCLLAQYRREKIRVDQVEAGERGYKDAWWGLEPLGFLDDQYYRKRPSVQVKQDVDQGPLESYVQEFEEIQDDATVAIPQMASRRAAKRRLLLRRREPTKVVKLRCPEPPAEGRDEFSSYAETVAHRLRALANRKSRLVVMNQIDNLLFSAQMEELEVTSQLIAFLPDAADARDFESVCEQTLDHGQQ